MRQKLSIVLYISVAFWVCLESTFLGDAVLFADLTSLLFVLIPSVAGLWVGVQYAPSVKFTCLSVVAFVSGWVGFLIGLVQTLGNAMDSASLFAGLGVALIPVFYSSLLVFVCLPFVFKELHTRYRQKTDH